MPAVAIHKPPRMTPDVNAEGIVALILAFFLSLFSSCNALFLHRSLVMRVEQPLQAALLGG